MVPYTGNADDTVVKIDPDEIGTDLRGIEWRSDAASLREYAIKADCHGVDGQTDLQSP